MTRRERHVAILKRMDCPYGSWGYEMFTDGDIEEMVRNGLWWRGLHRHNMRVTRQWFESAYKNTAQRPCEAI